MADHSIKKNQKQTPPLIQWDHKIFRVYSHSPDFDRLTIDMDSERIDHIFIDDINEEVEELSLEGWRYITGFALDDNSFYLMYKRPSRIKKE
ncbi:MAG: hypothetical protein PHE86_00145 [Candidatus Marinimicrobia bacterium]|nr:hypothetical protein [Candidatus Neomarinimicrobiota bacterium]MDD5581590.1 hypothetical protein [Candidatus Neomarinimicrobiota bacterium]